MVHIHHFHPIWWSIRYTINSEVKHVSIYWIFLWITMHTCMLHYLLDRCNKELRTLLFTLLVRYIVDDARSNDSVERCINSMHFRFSTVDNERKTCLHTAAVCVFFIRTIIEWRSKFSTPLSVEFITFGPRIFCRVISIKVRDESIKMFVVANGSNTWSEPHFISGRFFRSR